MKVNSLTVPELLSSLRELFQENTPLGQNPDETPFRAELFNSDQMEVHAKVLAKSHSEKKGKAANKLLRRLDQNESVLLKVRNLLVERIHSSAAITPAGEWLLDNFYLIEEQVIIARKHLPKGYSEGLPYLQNGRSAGMPRVYDMVLEIISHSDGRVDSKSLCRFIASYQSEKTLTLGELWAIPIMLRLAVIENLRRVSERIALDMIDNKVAEYWADKMIATANDDPSKLILTVAEMAKTDPIFNSPFVASFVRQLQGKGPSIALVLNWLEQHLSRSGTTSNDLVWQENQKLAIDQVSVRNSIETLRYLTSTDWRDFVEELSAVEAILRQDHSGTYPQMDFATRDSYRHAVESIAKKGPFSESEVAHMAVDLAAERQRQGKRTDRSAFVGYYLVDQGRAELERIAKMKHSAMQSLRRAAGRAPVFLYLSSIMLLTGAGTAGMLLLAYNQGFPGGLVLMVLGLAALAGSGQLAISLANWISTLIVRPKSLPRMDFSKGIPEEFRTLITVPTMLSGEADIEELIEALEVRFLANRENHLHFSLLTDLLDADTETTPRDEALVALVSKRIEELNEKYKQDGLPDIFFLFHRSRRWNAIDQKWMGYERKRGKLSALNALIIEGDESAFSRVIGKTDILRRVKYVITLDSDTQLPREAAWKLVAAMAHPLNHAVYDADKKRVTAGYGILQPRIASDLPKTVVSLYLRMQGDMNGIDPYTRASSDVYQDLFGQGSFIGKGIYDVRVFEKAAGNIFPENRILSHDLLEGCYTRSGLLSDVLLYEKNPSRYEDDVKRHHRWIRGDWQIGAWTMPWFTGSEGTFKRNTLSTLSRWKIADNLRRSVLPLSLLTILLMGWTILPFPWFWTLAVTFIVLLPVMMSALLQLIQRPEDMNLKAHATDVVTSVRDVLLRFMFGLAVLPYEAYRNCDAILRSNWRMIVSGRHLLEWTPSVQASRGSSHSIWSNYQKMWAGPFLALLCVGWFLYLEDMTLFTAGPILLLWLLSPALAWRLSKPEKAPGMNLSDEQNGFLHRSARKHWLFFEHFVSEEDNWLPPDNYQEQPEAKIAHRTSPTNIGLALLANLTAYDFAYIPVGQVIRRCQNTMRTLNRMDRYKGHFYNWYDTQTLSTMQPRYVSTVDSGNLVGHLLTLRQGVYGLMEKPVFHPGTFQGLKTTIELIAEHSEERQEPIDTLLEATELIIAGKTLSLQQANRQLNELKSLSENIRPGSRVGEWLQRFLQQLASTQEDLLLHAPWIPLLPVPDQFENLYNLDHIPSFEKLSGLIDNWQKQAHGYRTTADGEGITWLEQLSTALEIAQERSRSTWRHIEQIGTQCEELSQVEYDFLFNKSTNLFRIGFNVDEQRKDDSYYDMLASESRLGIFVAIAQGKIPQESWFTLGRLLTHSNSGPILLSWSGSMFEYLMPQLVMPSYEHTLLYQTNIATVKRQIEYGHKRGIPWGISESGYNNVDTHLNYQYHAFGVPGLGLKRGLEGDLVVAPYASMLALMILPEKACANLQTMAEAGFEGTYGFFEAIDYTASRLPRGNDHAIVSSYMSHHQGMSFLSLAYALLDKPMQKRFVAELRFQATLLLLQEKIPKTTVFYAHTSDIKELATTINNTQVRRITTPNSAIPELQLLSNGHYQVMISNSGGGYSRWNDLAITRWRDDGTKDNHGIFCYIKDIESGKFWSNTHQPTLQKADNYEVIFSQGMVEFNRRDYGLETKTEVVVSPEDDAEMRRIRIINRSQSVRVLEVTSYCETVLASQASDESHPAFSNLFVQTEILRDYNSIISTRRPRSENEHPAHVFHVMDVHGTGVDSISYETDRMQFIGRGHNLAHPRAMEHELSEKEGSVLDPIMAIRYRITLRPGQTATIDLIYGIGDSRETAEAIMHKYRDRVLKKRAFELSWTHSQVLLRQINASESDAQLFGKLAASIIFSNPALRADEAIIRSNNRGQSGLWSHSVSGDLPIVLLQVSDPDSLELVTQMIKAHTYWQLKGLAVDLVIWNEDHGTYRQVLHDQILGMISAGNNLTHHVPGNVFVRSSDQISSEDRILFNSIARVIIRDDKGTLYEQVHALHVEKGLPPFLDVAAPLPERDLGELQLPSDLLCFNGHGGFTSDGTEYKIQTQRKNTTPAPWVNVIANSSFGTVLSESGSAYTWALNAHEYRITPWSNDPVSDIAGEAFFIRDEENGKFWSPSPYPALGDGSYITTHGFGYSGFEHNRDGIATEMRVFVDKDLPIKFVVLKIVNRSGRPRKLTGTGFLEIILGDVRSKTNMHILSEFDLQNEALLFRNRYHSSFSERVTFFKVTGASHLSYTADRREFIGRNGSLSDPQAMKRTKLSGRTGAGIDACAALQVSFELLDGGEKEVIFQIGNESTYKSAIALMQGFNDGRAVAASLSGVREFWTDALQAVQIETPDKALNILANGWLTYQTLASRLFARSGFYQSGGAIGFRDQLQDVLSLFHTKPELARAQILLNASRQFVEGDVQHWWHPPEGRGVRTRCSDDMLWLPFAVTRYLKTTGDQSILKEREGFLQMRALHMGEDSLYDLPSQGNDSGDLYEHCVRAIKHSLVFGERGLPLIGSGDWNDGMDLVGNEGKGESVWLAFFLYRILKDFSTVAKGYNDELFAQICLKEAATLRTKIERYAWDGEWYRRAWFDNGTALGSKENDECRIDAISQSWSVLSQAAPLERMNQAMTSLDKHLVRRDIGLIQLLEPAFDKSHMNPGYIKGYVPGVRENGGQYSHAAIWTLMAFADLKDRKKVYELFNLIQPINHGSTREAIDIYKVEPYVMAADVYANTSHEGRGGWTWYTGSSGWMYQFILESFIGLERIGELLRFKPCFPLDWPSVKIHYHFKNSTYAITVFQQSGIEQSFWKSADRQGSGNEIILIDNGLENQVEIHYLIEHEQQKAEIA